MAKKTTKTSKKFEMKRGEIATKLYELAERLENIDVSSTSPNNMNDFLGEMVLELSELADAVNQVVY